jgi:hypothetical protein
MAPAREGAVSDTQQLRHTGQPGLMAAVRA